jgi:SAM-dependent methyltransferase
MPPSALPGSGSRTEALRDWYDRHAETFRSAATIERAFLRLPPEAQRRSNDFKLGFLDPGGRVDLTGQRVLELGCGHGRLAIERPVFAEYVGVDFSEALVRIGRERLCAAGLEDRARLVVGDARTYEGVAASFDVVCSLGLFEFVEEPERVLANMVRLLRPGGSLFFDVHVASPLYDPIRRWRWRRAEARGAFPKRSFGIDEARRLALDAGLVDPEIRMTEYPVLGDVYVRTGARWALRFRDALAAHHGADVLATDAVVIARKPSA